MEAVDINELRRQPTLTVAEAAAVARLSERTIQRYVADPEMKAFQRFSAGRRAGRRRKRRAGFRSGAVRILSAPFFKALDGEL